MLKKIISRLFNHFGYEIKRIKNFNPEIKIEPRPYKSERNAEGYNEVWNCENFIDQYTSQHMTLYNTIIEFMLNLKVFDSSKSIADIGCGPGNLIGLISQKYPDKTYYVFDFSIGAIEAARRKFDSVHFQLHDIYEPFEISFDTVICSETLEHLLDPHKALKNLLNATLKSCILTIPDGRIDNYQGHINFWSEESFESFLGNYSESWNFRVYRLGLYIGAVMFKVE